MLNVMRSELVRTRRKGVILGWFGLTALFAFMINMVMVQVVTDGSAPPENGPGVSFPSARVLESSEGLVAGLASASGMFGVVTLSFWAIVTATDYSTGLIRLLASAQPHRGRLLLGKVAALVAWTAAVTVVALLANLLAAPMAAGASDLDLSNWGQDLVPTLASAWFNLFCTLIVWGAIGMVLALATRSAAIAVSVGIGYVLVVEAVIKAAAENIGDWLPGTTLSALARGGTAELSYAGALGLGTMYTVVGLVIALAIFRRRDITD